MKNYTKILLGVICGLLFAQLGEARVFRNATFIRTEKPIVAIVFFSDGAGSNNGVGFLDIKDRESYLGDNFSQALTDAEKQRLRDIVSNTNPYEVADAMKILKTDARNTVIGNNSNFDSYHATLTGQGTTIKINLGPSYLPVSTINFDGLEAAITKYRKAPASEKGKYLFFAASDRSSGLTVNLYVPDFL